MLNREHRYEGHSTGLAMACVLARMNAAAAASVRLLGGVEL
jgi:hypothetical protein